jgi:hypothetical protein
MTDLAVHDGPIFAFTMTDLAVHDGPIFAFTMTDLAVHDGPIFAFTMVRNSHVSHLAFRVGRAGYARWPVAVGRLLAPAGPSGHESGKSSCWRVGDRRVTERW